MPKAVGRLPAYATASFRTAVLAEHPKEKERPKSDDTNAKAGDVTTKPADNSSVQCHACNTRVYEMEKLVADNYAYHKKCFKCCKCDRILRVGNYASMDAQIYCKPHFVECFKQNGNYEEGFGKEKLGIRNSMQESGSSDEKENVPSATGKKPQLERDNSAEVTSPPVPPSRPADVATSTDKRGKDGTDSQSVTTLNSTEFTLALEEKKKKLMQAAQASEDKNREKSYKPAPGRLRPPPELLSSGQQSPSGGIDSQSGAENSPNAIASISGSSSIGVAAATPLAVRQRHLESPARRDVRPVSWNGQATADNHGSAAEEAKKISHASAAAATIAPGSIKMKLLDLEAAKEASRAAAAVQRQQRMEAEARAAAEAAAALALAASEADFASDDVPHAEPTGLLPLRLAEVATVKSKFESGEANVTPVQQTAAREEVEHFRTQVGPRAAAIRSRFQKRAASKAGLSAARSLPDLSPAGDGFDGEEAVDDARGSLDDETLDGTAAAPAATAGMDAESVPKPGQLRNILSKLQSMQEAVDKKERTRPRPLQIPGVDRYCSDGGSVQSDAVDASSDGVSTDATYNEQLWPKKAKSLREKFECKEEHSSEGQSLQSPKRPKPINILAEIEAYEQHNKAMGMTVKYVVESKGADSSADTQAADAATAAAKDKQ